MKRMRMVKNTVKEVMIVLLKVSLIDELMISAFDKCGFLRKFSLTRSNTITVSFIEKPITVRMAAIKCWSISSAKGTCPRANEKTARVTHTSCSKAITVPIEYCHLRKRKRMYKKMASIEMTVALTAPFFRSSEMVGNTVFSSFK